MKIALCYSGNLRTYEYCVKNHSELLGNNTDIFVSTWDTINRAERINDPWHFKCENIMPNSCDEKYIEKHTPKNFNIVSIKIESYKDYSFSNQLLYQYLKIKDCYNLISNPENYDFIVRIRPDIVIENFVFEREKLVFDQHIWYNYKYTPNVTFSTNEMIWSGNYELMEKSVRIIDNFTEVSKYEPNGECICYRNLEYENLIDKTVFRNFNYKVIR